MTKLSNERVEELDELDTVARTAARQSGHSHVIAQLPAMSSIGRVVGRLTCLVSTRHMESFLLTSALTSSAKKKSAFFGCTLGLHMCCGLHAQEILSFVLFMMVVIVVVASFLFTVSRMCTKCTISTVKGSPLLGPAQTNSWVPAYELIRARPETQRMKPLAKNGTSELECFGACKSLLTRRRVTKIVCSLQFVVRSVKPPTSNWQQRRCLGNKGPPQQRCFAFD